MGPSDRIKVYLEAFIRRVFVRLDFLAYYRSRVVAQDSDGSLQVQPDDARLPGMTGVPIRYGVPGVTVTLDLSAPAYVFVGFEGGNPGRPFALIWESGNVATFTVSTTTGNIVLNAGGAGVGTTGHLARVGDQAGNHTHAAGAYVAGIYAVTGVSAATNPTIATGAPKVQA